MNRTTHHPLSSVPFFQPKNLVFLKGAPSEDMKSVHDIIKQPNQSKEVPENPQARENIGKIKGEITKMLFDAEGKVSPRLLQQYREKVNKVGENNVAALVELKSEIEVRTERFKDYTNKILEHKKHFRPESIKKYLEGFADLSTKEEQERWLDPKVFEAEVLDHKKYTDEFEEFPKPLQSKNSIRFFNASREEKAVILEAMKGDLRRECDSAIDASPSCEAMKQSTKHYLSDPKRSVKEIKDNLEYLKINSITERNLNNAYLALPKELRDHLEKKFSEIYKNHIKPENPHDLYKGRTPKNFSELMTIKEKKDFLEHIHKNKTKFEKERTIDKTLKEQYDKKLKEAEAKHVLSHKTVKLYKEWFQKELKAKGSKHADSLVKNFWKAPENQERKKRLDEFEVLMTKLEKEKKLTPSEKKQHQDKFYESSHSERLKHLEKLKKGNLSIDGDNEADTSDDPKANGKKESTPKTPQEKKIMQLKADGDHAMEYELWKNAIDDYKEVLKINPKDHDAEMKLQALFKHTGQSWPEEGVAGLFKEQKDEEASIDIEPKKIEATLDKIVNSETMKEKRKAVTRTELLTTLAWNSERRHQGITKVEQRTENLDTRQREIHDEVGKATDNETILTKKEGIVEAQTVEKVNLRKLSNGQDKDSLMQAKKIDEQLKTIQHDPKKIEEGMDNLQFLDDEQRVLRAEDARAEAAEQKDDLHNEIITRMINELGLNQGNLKQIVAFSTMMKKTLEQRDLSEELTGN